MFYYRLISIFMTLMFLASCGPGLYLKEKTTLEELFLSHPIIQNKLDSFTQYEAQVIYIQITRDKHNKPHFKTFKWNTDSQYYYYPASTVKMPAALIAVEKINQLALAHPGLNLFTPMKIDSIRPPQSAVLEDISSWNRAASIGQYLKKIFIVSDNDAFNRLYEFLGQAYLNARLKTLGYRNTHIIHRLDAPQFNYQSNKYTNPVHFFDEDRTYFNQEEQYNPDDVRVGPLRSIRKGDGYLSGDSLVRQPFDFGYKNFFSLEDMSGMVKNIFFHEYIPEKEKFNITPDQLKYIRKSMSTLPRESHYPTYDTTYHDGYAKFIMVGGTRDTVPGHIRIFNKAGWAYGYLTDAAYIVDFKNKTEFILAATINTNTDGIFNDGIYQYESLGLPYLNRLGTLIYQYELRRERKYKPDLDHFRFDQLP